ncbi:MAG: hypothetical protein KTR23_12860 [Rhodospirillales bacterium]|nr:hypothetical protein [Rhodospirillales bacterium]
MMRNIFKTTAWGGLVAGLFLLALNILSFFYLPERHSSTVGETPTKAGIALRESDVVLDKLLQLTKLENEQDIEQLTKLFASGVMHYWPDENGWDNEVLTDFRENWVTALIERIELALLERGLVQKPDYVRRERLDYRNIVAKGVGICSQVSLGVTDFARKLGLNAFTWSLSGHVVSVIGPLADGQVYVVDGDYAVYLPLTPEEIVEQPKLIEPAYLDAGYSVDHAEFLASIYGPEGNFEYGTEVSWKVVALQWGGALGILLTSMVMLFCLRVRSR